MKQISEDVLASIKFSVSYKHNGILHRDGQFGHRVNLWRDILPEGFYETLKGKTVGEVFEQWFEIGSLVPLLNEKKIHSLRLQQADTYRQPGHQISPRFGRFYPSGILRGVPGVYRNNVTPFRCIGVSNEHFTADLNHPLAEKSLVVKAEVTDVREKFDERGGTSVDWADELLNGPGIQMRVKDRPTDFFLKDSFMRYDEKKDALFYEKPRMVQHLDERAIDVIKTLYGNLIPPESDVLDLMASWVSHIPDTLKLKSVTGLGMNEAELAANPRFNEFWVYDLNENPKLDFKADHFDAIICTVSIEYLTQPFEVFQDILRVLRPGGVFIVTFSNRWFPSKATKLWTELHEFERVGLVLEYFLRSGKFRDLNTESIRGLPRPDNDKYASSLMFSDPVYAVWGYKT